MASVNMLCMYYYYVMIRNKISGTKVPIQVSNEFKVHKGTDQVKNCFVNDKGGFHVVAKIIRELKSHMIPYKFMCWWKINL